VPGVGTVVRTVPCDQQTSQCMNTASGKMTTQLLRNVVGGDEVFEPK